MRFAQMKMPTKRVREIERKFLIKRLPPETKGSRRYRIVQGYLVAEPDDRHVRLRKKGKSASLTFKIVDGSVREEREIKLSAKQFAALWPGTAGRRLRKVRYEIPWKGVLIEIDVYAGKNKGLTVAEIEFPSRAACRKFKPPDWFGREVTGDRRYSNIALATE
jgi:adenylate cyclase